MAWAINAQTDVVTDSANKGIRSRSTGSSGAVRLSCLTTSTNPETPAITSSTTIWTHESPWPISDTPNNSVPKATACSAALMKSNLLPDSGVNGSVRNAMTAPRTPSGTFTANSHGHGATARIAEATVGPNAEAIDPTVAFSPTPRPSQRRGYIKRIRALLTLM